MSVICPNCDRPGTAMGQPCTACGTPMIAVRESENLIGTVIDGRFEIVAELGKGGMGTVYRATQRSIGRDVALKLIDRRFEEDVTAVKRFLREAKLASQLSHPNTVHVIECGQSPDGRLYLAMELVRGKTLQEIVAEGALATARVIKIGMQLCDALQAAHALSIVHRDLKLENVMVLEGDFVKVLDFGLARSLTEAESRATVTGAVVGTPRYLAPEVALGGALAAPAQDLYALGVVLAELALGGALWEAPTLEALFTLKLQRAPRLDTLPASLRAIVEQLLDQDPGARPTAAQTHAMLEQRSQSPTALEHTLALPSGTLPPLPSAAFAPPAPPEVELVVDEAWVREKAERVERASRPPPRRPLGLASIAAAIACIAAVIAIGVYFATRRPPVPPPLAGQHQPSTPNTVTISVTAPANTQIVFDQQPAGRAPLTMYVRKRSSSLVITAVIAGATQTRAIVPDHDQTVGFTDP